MINQRITNKMATAVTYLRRPLTAATLLVGGLTAGPANVELAADCLCYYQGEPSSPGANVCMEGGTNQYDQLKTCVSGQYGCYWSYVTTCTL